MEQGRPASFERRPPDCCERKRIILVLYGAAAGNFFPARDVHTVVAATGECNFSGEIRGRYNEQLTTRPTGEREGRDRGRGISSAAARARQAEENQAAADENAINRNLLAFRARRSCPGEKIHIPGLEERNVVRITPTWRGSWIAASYIRALRRATPSSSAWPQLVS